MAPILDNILKDTYTLHSKAETKWLLQKGKPAGTKEKSQ